MLKKLKVWYVFVPLVRPDWNQSVALTIAASVYAYTVEDAMVTAKDMGFLAPIMEEQNEYIQAVVRRGSRALDRLTPRPHAPDASKPSQAAGASGGTIHYVAESVG